jgi:hypothetical protein
MLYAGRKGSGNPWCYRCRFLEKCDLQDREPEKTVRPLIINPDGSCQLYPYLRKKQPKQCGGILRPHLS